MKALFLTLFFVLSQSAFAHDDHPIKWPFQKNSIL